MLAPTAQNTGRIAIPDGSDSAVQYVPNGTWLFKPDWPTFIAFYATEAAATADTLDPTATRAYLPGGPETPPAGLGQVLLGNARQPVEVPSGTRYFKITAAPTSEAFPVAPTPFLEWSAA